MAIFLLTIVGLMLAGSAVNAEKVRNYRMCPNSDCLVNEMFIDPCPGASYNKACEWSRNSTTSIAFIYKPEFGSNLPKAQLYAETRFMDWPILSDTNACLYTSCPVEKDTEQYWLFNLYVPEYYVRTYYTVKFVLWDTINNQQCCFKIDINIV